MRVLVCGDAGGASLAQVCVRIVCHVATASRRVDGKGADRKGPRARSHSAVTF